MGSPAANQTSEEACRKSNLKTIKKERKTGDMEFLFRFSTEAKECKTIAIIDIFSAR